MLQELTESFHCLLGTNNTIRHLSGRSYNANNLVKPMLDSALKRNNFYRCIDVWNFIPVAIRTNDSFVSFKRAIANIDFTCFIVGTYSV